MSNYIKEIEVELDGEVTKMPVGVPPMVDVFMNDLYKMCVDGKLVPGQFYRIIDYNPYESLHSLSDYYDCIDPHYFDIIVRADSEHQLNSEAYATHGKLNDDRYFDGSDLSKWKLWFDIENSDRKKYPWINKNSKQKGVIYRMVDEFGNDCPYDFKNIQFRRYITMLSCNLGNIYDEKTNDCPLSFFKIKDEGDLLLEGLFDNIVLKTDQKSVWRYTFNIYGDNEYGEDESLYGNCCNNVITRSSKNDINNIIIYGNNNVINDSFNLNIYGNNNNITNCYDLHIFSSGNKITDSFNCFITTKNNKNIIDESYNIVIFSSDGRWISEHNYVQTSYNISLCRSFFNDINNCEKIDMDRCGYCNMCIKLGGQFSQEMKLNF